MSKKFFIVDMDHDSILYYCILNVVTEYNKRTGFPISNIPNKNDNGSLDIKLTINGHEMDVDYFMESLHKNYTTAIKKNAEELIKQKCNSIF